MAANIALADDYAVRDNFRVNNKVFASGKAQPDSRGTTIFQDGLVYDYLEQPAEVIVFDPAAGKFTLLDMTRRVRTELTTGAVETFNARIKQTASGNPNALVRFLADPGFQEQFDEKIGELTLISPWMTYSVRLTLGQRSAVVDQYRQFSDWIARLNIVMNPGTRPPFARMVLNQAIAKHQAMPREVELTFKEAGQSTTVRSQHEVVLQLAANDLAEIANARAAMQNFKQVSFEDYRKGTGR